MRRLDAVTSSCWDPSPQGYDKTLRGPQPRSLSRAHPQHKTPFKSCLPVCTPQVVHTSLLEMTRKVAYGLSEDTRY